MRCEAVWLNVLSMRAWIGGPVEAVSFIFRSPPKLLLVLTCIAALFLGPLLSRCNCLGYRVCLPFAESSALRPYLPSWF